MKRNNKGMLGALEIAMIVIVIGILGFVGWRVATSESDSEADIVDGIGTRNVTDLGAVKLSSNDVMIDEFGVAFTLPDYLDYVIESETEEGNLLNVMYVSADYEVGLEIATRNTGEELTLSVMSTELNTIADADAESQITGLWGLYFEEGIAIKEFSGTKYMMFGCGHYGGGKCAYAVSDGNLYQFRMELADDSTNETKESELESLLNSVEFY